MNGKIIRVFQNVDMRNQHEGLRKISLDNNIDTTELENCSYVIFINKKQTILKVFSGHNVLATHKPYSGRLSMESIQYIPEAFGGGSDFNMTRAVKTALKEVFNLESDNDSRGIGKLKGLSRRDKSPRADNAARAL